MTIKTAERPDTVRGVGGGRSSDTYATLEEIAAQAEEDGFGKEWYVVSQWSNAATAGSVARGITHSNTRRALPGNQKTPPGYWIAGVTKLDVGGAEVRCQFFGDTMPQTHPCFEVTS